MYLPALVATQIVSQDGHWVCWILGRKNGFMSRNRTRITPVCYHFLLIRLIIYLFPEKSIPVYQVPVFYLVRLLLSDAYSRFFSDSFAPVRLQLTTAPTNLFHYRR